MTKTKKRMYEILRLLIMVSCVECIRYFKISDNLVLNIFLWVLIALPFYSLLDFLFKVEEE